MCSGRKRDFKIGFVVVFFCAQWFVYWTNANFKWPCWFNYSSTNKFVSSVKCTNSSYIMKLLIWPTCHSLTYGQVLWIQRYMTEILKKETVRQFIFYLHWIHAENILAS